jgi:hypothetical protein
MALTERGSVARVELDPVPQSACVNNAREWRTLPERIKREYWEYLEWFYHWPCHPSWRAYLNIVKVEFQKEFVGTWIEGRRMQFREEREEARAQARRNSYRRSG